MNVIVIRHHDADVLAVVEVPPGRGGDQTFRRWKRSDPSMRELIDFRGLYWELIRVQTDDTGDRPHAG